MAEPELARPMPLGWEGVAGQLMRYGIVGAILSLITSVTYLVPALWLGVPPLIANLIAWVATATAGFFLHGRITFRGYGRRDRTALRAIGFLAVSLVSLALNSFFVFALTELMHLSAWWPLLPMIFVTPVVSFAVQRLVVFR